MDNVIKIAHQTPALDENYVLLLTSNSEEKRAINAVLRDRRTADIGIETTGCSLGTLGGRFVLHVTGESGVSKALSVARIASALLKNNNFPKPVLTVLAGFCWGNPKNVGAEVCIVATEVVALNIRHAEGDAEVPQAQRLVSIVTLEEPVVRELEDHLRVRIGSLASLETLYKSDRLRERLVERYPELLGGEMEAFGFLESGSRWLVVKAVSDAGGDDFSREKQGEAARRASVVIEPLLVTLQRHEVVDHPRASIETAHLYDLLSGDTIEFDVREIGKEALTDHLEFGIGLRAEYKLRQYVSDRECSADFVRHLLAAILEVVQNAVRHGKANRSFVSFYATKVVIEDDGQLYDIRCLTDGRGGAMAVQALLKLGEETGAMELTVGKSKRLKGNKYTFNLVKASSALREAREKCLLRVRESSIGMLYGRPEVFSFDSRCRTVYLDGTRIRMTSRHFELAAALRPLVEEGRKVYVGCRSEQEIFIYKQELKDLAGENLVLFVDATLPQGI
ncbi:hypothetical protein ACLSSQ_11925 [Azospira sp. APE16]|uniref:hypothetical protein n=1 Tax=Azospira sp. APE16 TaxID=3394231 RepID=UPI003A4E5526